MIVKDDLCQSRLKQSDLMPTIVDQRIFLPTRDLAQSIDFYSRMGWKARFRDENLALMELGASRVFLQKHYQKE